MLIMYNRYYDSIGRKKMMFSSYFTTGLLIIGQSVLFKYYQPSITWQTLIWFVIFLVASSGASSAHLTVSELFPV